MVEKLSFFNRYLLGASNNSQLSSAIPLGMERSVKKHPLPPNPTFRRNDTRARMGTFLTECVAPRILPVSTERFIPNGMKNASDLQHLAPRPHPRPLSKGEGSRDTIFGASLPSPLERGRG
ncbi:MAG: hypothetical protein LBB79_08150 [Prevotellaceae bacterium]|nr:hypothetical protein [Prevotellaceae bacterium]